MRLVLVYDCRPCHSQTFNIIPHQSEYHFGIVLVGILEYIPHNSHPFAESLGQSYTKTCGIASSVFLGIGVKVQNICPNISFEIVETIFKLEERCMLCKEWQ